MNRTKLQLLLFNPLAYLVITFKKFDFYGIKWAICLITILYGVNLIPGGDLLSHITFSNELESGFSLNEWMTKIGFNFLATVKDKELYPSILYSVSSFFYNNEKVFLILSAGLYGYFFGWTLELILMRVKKQPQRTLFFITLFVFIMMHSFVNFQSIRFPAGLKVLFVILLIYFFTKNKKVLLFLPLAGYFHFAIFIFIIMSVLSLLIPLKKWLLFGLVFGSFALGTSNMDSIVSTYFGGAALEAKQGYIVEQDEVVEHNERVSKRVATKQVYGQVYRYSRWLGLNAISIILLLFFFKDIRKSKYKQIFIVGTSFIIAVNLFFVNIPTLANRLAIFASLLMFAFILLYSDILLAVKSFRRNMLISSYIFFVPLILFELSKMVNTLSITFIFLPFLGIFIPSEDLLSIKDFLTLNF